MLTSNDPSEQEVSKASEPTKQSRVLVRLGLTITVFYIVTLIVIAISHWQAMLSLSPNEWGDYLAGTFGPLALLWLVLGFFQQGHELRYSAQALWLQSEELKNSVEQQRALVEATRQQIDFEREKILTERDELHRQAQPIFKFLTRGTTRVSQGEVIINVNLTNAGQDCTDISILQGSVIRKILSIFRRGDTVQFSLSHKTGSDETNFTIEYVDAVGKRNVKNYLNLGNKFQEISRADLARENH